MNTVLMLAQWFPPCQAWPTAATRVRLLASHLPEYGWRAIVLAPDMTGGACSCAWCSDPGRARPLDSPALTVHRLPVRRSLLRTAASWLSLMRRPGSSGPTAAPDERVSTRLRDSLAAVTWLLGDAHSDWPRAAARHADQLLSHHQADALWTTSAPFSHIRIGARLSRRHGVPWIADLRDPASTDVTADGCMEVFVRARRSTYRKPLLAADAITTAIHHVPEVDGPWLGRKVTVIPHGFDRDEWLVARSQATQRTDRLEIVYAGKLYEDHQRLDIFLRGLMTAAESLGPDARNQLRFVYYGRSGSLLMQQSARYGCVDMVEDRGFVPPASIPVKMASAAVLLLLTIERGIAGVPGGKLYEYLAAHRPILAVPGGDHVTGVLSDTGAGVVAQDDREVADHIVAWFSRWRAAGGVDFRGHADEINSHSARGSARRLAELLETSARPTRRSPPGACSANMTTRLTASAPLPHRMAHRLAAGGVRGADRYWRLAEMVVRPPEAILLEVAAFPNVEVHPADMGERLLYRGLHEREERAIVRGLIDPGSICIDVGANVGSYTTLLASLTGASGFVAAFEPNPVVRQRLERAVAAMPWVTVFPFALSDSNSEAILVEEPGHTGRSTLRAASRAGGTMVTVDLRRLDELDVIPHSGVVDFLKIDVEGWEGSVLAGSQGLFETARVGALMLEASPEFGSLDYLAPLLAHKSYTAWAIRSVHSRNRLRFRPQLVPVRRHEDILSQCNLLFVRDDRVARVRSFFH